MSKGKKKEITWLRCDVAITGVLELIKKTEQIIQNIQDDKKSGRVIRSARQKREKEKAVAYRMTIEILEKEQDRILPF